MNVRASRVMAFLYWLFMRNKDEEQAYQMDRVLGFVTDDVAREHDLGVVAAAGGEVG